MGISRLIASLESCPIGDGDLVGQPFKCLTYQRRFLRGAFADGVMRAGLSVARGAGKTGLCSCLGAGQCAAWGCVACTWRRDRCGRVFLRTGTADV